MLPCSTGISGTDLNLTPKIGTNLKKQSGDDVMNAPQSAFSNSAPHVILNEDFQALRLAFENDRYPEWSVRKQRLKNLVAMIQKYREEFKTAISKDFGHRSAQESEMVELFPSWKAFTTR